MRSILNLFVLLLLLAACGGGNDSQDASQQRERAAAYLEEVLSIMQTHALTRYEVDWAQVRAEANQLAENATTIAGTYPAITRALELINTNHSLLTSASGRVITYPSIYRCEQDLVLDTPDAEGIGYVRVDGFSSNDSQQERAFAQTIQDQIAEQDNAAITGWIVDLRNNTGGNMWPMVAGLGPLFDSTLLGHFVDADGQFSAWGYDNGRAYSRNQTLVRLEQPYTLLNPLPKIAVLSSKRVASSGEATLIAFKQQANVRFFGSDTCGLSTGNSGFTLSDGSILLLTTVITADREQNVYGKEVAVDQASAPQNTLAEAVSWLQQ